MTQMGGQNLGTAAGKIVIDASDLARIQALTQQIGQQVARNLGQIDVAAQKTEKSVNSIAATLNSLGSNLGLATGLGLVTQMGRMVLQADAMATAYRRQSVAAVSLAGNQAKLNELLRTYDRVTGGAIDKATALGDVTRLQAVGFADSAEELERFTIAARGISVAMGAQQDYVIGQLQLAIANQSTMRLDQIGLGVEEVTSRIKELRAADSSLTEAQAYQNAILGIATQKYGALAKSVEAQATGAEKAAKAWKELQLQVGEDAGGAVSGVMQGLANELDGISQKFQDLARDIEYAKRVLTDNGWTMPQWLKTALSVGSQGVGGGSLEIDYLRGQMASRRNMLAGLLSGRELLRTDPNATPAAMQRQEGLIEQVNRDLADLSRQLLMARSAAGQFAGVIAYYQNSGGTRLDGPSGIASTPSYTPRFTNDQNAAIRQWATDVQAVERQAADARLDATRQFEQQRSQTISDYGRTVAREEQDFARNRARAITQYNRQIAEAQEDAAKRAADAIRDYAEAVADVQRDAARREAKWIEDYNERVAEMREDGNKRLAELERDYNRDRERAAEDHRDRLFDAAARLDAIAVREEQKNYARQQKDAEDNYNEQRQKINEALGEQLADAQEAQQERLEEAREADAERLADMKEAHERQLAEAREADAERLADMERDFAERLAQEDEERAIANQRRAEDHAIQMQQMADAQAERLRQIEDQEEREKQALEEAFLQELEELGIHNDAWLELQRKRQAESIKLFDEWMKEIEKKLKEQLPPEQGPQEPRNLDLFGYANGGPVMQTRRALVHSGEYVLNAQTTAALRSQLGGFDQRSLVESVGGRNVTIAPGAIVVYGAAGQNEQVIGQIVYDKMVEHLERVAS